MSNYSIAAKRRAKRKQAKLAGLELAETPKRDKSGCFVERTRQTSPDREPTQTVLKARARHMGQAEGKFKKMTSVMLSDAAGMALIIICTPDTAKRMWSHYAALTASEARYHKSLGLSIHAKTAKIEMQPERFETRADDTPDLRTESERDEAAAKSWDEWNRHLNRIGINHRAAIDTAKQDFAPLVIEGRVTPAGRRFVEAMIALDKVVS